MSDLKSLKGQHPGILLRDLAEKRRGVGDAIDRLPWVTLFLSTGHELSGHVLDVMEDKGSGGILLLHVPGPDPRAPKEDAAHIPLEHVRVVVQHDLGAQGRPPKDAPPAPSKLDLQRRAKELETWLAGQGFPVEVDLAWEGGEGAHGLERVLESVRHAWGSIAGEELGRASLKEVRKLRLVVGDRLEAERRGEILRLTAPKDWSGVSGLTEDRVQATLERAL